MAYCPAPAGRGLSYTFSVFALGTFVLSPQRLPALGTFSRSWGLAPSLALNAVDGTTVALMLLEYPVTIEHFFATGCETCRAELPSLRRFAERAGRSSIIRILAGSGAEPDLRVLRFVQAMPLHFPGPLDRDGAATRPWSLEILDRSLKPRPVVERELDWGSNRNGRIPYRHSCRRRREAHTEDKQ
jgi:thiol-disulfide isomerase/thioredoxin